MKSLIVCFLVFAFFDAKSQHLIDRSEKEVIEAVKKQHGIIKKRRSVDKYGFSSVAFNYPDNIKLKKGIYFSLFNFKNNKCTEYTENYAGAEAINEQQSKLNINNSGFKRDGDNLKWISNDKECQIHISEYFNNGQPTGRYVLTVSGKNTMFFE
ncbi:hypothetical protein ACFQZI_10990 [Mucilaginibacter lutimaris]|uniref:Uncharacterized protein n=1 Tax=Mucilaginibacter lutimaris TaxID=931629 RepID=A0ABW2ZGW7_9SPHI